VLYIRVDARGVGPHLDVSEEVLRVVAADRVEASADLADDEILTRNSEKVCTGSRA
jgi:hypothetical protein